MKDSWIRINVVLFYSSNQGLIIKKEIKKLYIPLDSIKSMYDFVPNTKLTYGDILYNKDKFSENDYIYKWIDYTKEYWDLVHQVKTVLKTKDDLYYVIETCEELIHQDF